MLFFWLTVLSVVTTLGGIILIHFERDATVSIVFSSILIMISFVVMLVFMVYGLLYVFADVPLWKKIRPTFERTRLVWYLVYLFILINIGMTAGVFTFWILDDAPGKQSQWDNINDDSAFRVYNRALFSAMLIFGTGGTTSIAPLSDLSKLYATFIIDVSWALTATLIGIIAAAAYERRKERRKADTKQNDGDDDGSANGSRENVPAHFTLTGLPGEDCIKLFDW